MTPQQIEFAERVARINAASAKGVTTLHVGPEESYQIDRIQSGRRGPNSEILSNAMFPVSLVVCFLIGVLAVLITKWVRFQLTDPVAAPLAPDIDMVVEFLGALVVTTLISQFGGMREAEQKLARVLGVVAGMLCLHNLVHLYPEVFSVLFSDIWVSRVLTTTKPYSILWRGISFTL